MKGQPYREPTLEVFRHFERKLYALEHELSGESALGLKYLKRHPELAEEIGKQQTVVSLLNYLAIRYPGEELPDYKRDAWLSRTGEGIILTQDFDVYFLLACARQLKEGLDQGRLGVPQVGGETYAKMHLLPHIVPLMEKMGRDHPEMDRDSLEWYRLLEQHINFCIDNWKAVVSDVHLSDLPALAMEPQPEISRRLQDICSVVARTDRKGYWTQRGIRGRAELMAAAAVQQGETVLDVGAGGGYATAALSLYKPGRIVAVDRDRQTEKSLKTIAEAAPARVEVYNGDVYDWEELVDVAVCSNAAFIEDRGLMEKLSTIARRAVVIGVPLSVSEQFLHKGEYHQLSRYTKEVTVAGGELKRREEEGRRFFGKADTLRHGVWCITTAEK